VRSGITGGAFKNDTSRSAALALAAKLIDATAHAKFLPVPLMILLRSLVFELIAVISPY
jgi:hypothetical protein